MPKGGFFEARANVMFFGIPLFSFPQVYRNETTEVIHRKRFTWKKLLLKIKTEENFQSFKFISTHHFENKGERPITTIIPFLRAY